MAEREIACERVFYGVNLPELRPENAVAILEIAQKIHEDENKRRQRKTRTYKWDEYWTNAYQMIIEVIKKGGKSDG